MKNKPLKNINFFNFFKTNRELNALILIIGILYLQSCNIENKEHNTANINDSLKKKLINDIKKLPPDINTPVESFIIQKKSDAIINEFSHLNYLLKIPKNDSITSFEIGKQITNLIFVVIILNDTSSIRNRIIKINKYLSINQNDIKFNHINNFSSDSLIRNLSSSIIQFYFQNEIFDKNIVAGINYQYLILTSLIVKENYNGCSRMLEAKWQYEAFFEELNDFFRTDTLIKQAEFNHLFEIMQGDYYSKNEEYPFVDTVKAIKLINKIKNNIP